MNKIDSSKVHTLHQKSSTWRTRKKCLSITSGMLSVIKDVYLPKKMVESSSRGLFYEQLLLALSCSAEYLTMKRLMIVFLALEGKGLLAPCIRRPRFTRIVKAPKGISCYLELGNLNFHVPIMCKPMYTATHRGEHRYKYKIVAVVVSIYFCGFSIKPRNLQPKNKLPC